MYSKQEDKANFKQHYPYPFYTTCSPTTLKFPETISSSNSSSVSKRTSSIVIPVRSAQDDDDDELYYEIPDKTFPKMTTKPAPSSSYWSWTFGIVTFPFIFWGCPFYLVLTERFPIRTTRKWLKCLFDFSTYPFLTVLTFLLLIMTVIVNVYFMYLFGSLFHSLFIAGAYEESFFIDLMDFLCDIPIIIPLNYVWLSGFKINNIISLLNQKYRMYSQIACAGYRVRLIGMLIVITCVHVIRYFSYRKYSFQKTNFLAVVHTIWECSVDIFVTLTFPVYCAFCYAIRFELSTIKTLVYELINKRVPPNISHLSTFKMLYTHAADHINAVNLLFSKYLSITILLTMVGTFIDAENLVSSATAMIFSPIAKALEGLLGAGAVEEKIGNLVNATMPLMNGSLSNMLPHRQGTLKPHGNQNQSNNGTAEDPYNPVTVRQINADIACILLVYALIFFTIWQAVGTNDWAREVHVWLNDFVAGAGGTDVKGMLMDLGVVDEDTHVNNMTSGLELDDSTQHEWSDNPPLIWARNKVQQEGQTDQFLEKFRMLKAYIHVRMQLENPALLYVSLVGVFVPSLTGRLKNYRVMA